MSIPKKIHYCWFGPNPYPRLVNECLETWKKNLSGYEICLWNESNSPMDIPFVKEAYQAKKYAFVADYVRFWALYNFGGIYLDTDMFLVKSLDDLLDNSCFFAWETDDKQAISCGVIGAEEKQTYIGAILAAYNELRFSKNNLDDFIVPRLITRVYNQSSYSGVYIYDYTLFYPFPYSDRSNIRNFKSYITSETYAVHLWNLSWVPLSSKIFSSVVMRIKKILKR